MTADPAQPVVIDNDTLAWSISRIQIAGRSCRQELETFIRWYPERARAWPKMRIRGWAPRCGLPPGCSCLQLSEPSDVDLKLTGHKSLGGLGEYLSAAEVEVLAAIGG
jgi:hypothetical protein